MLQYSSEFFEDVESIKKVEVLLGGDHGKGLMTFMAIVIIRYRSDMREDKVLELQIGQVDCQKDTIYLLKLILEKITPGIAAMNPKDGESLICVLRDEDRNVIVDFKKKERNWEREGGLSITCEWYIVGDHKFLMMMLGQQGYSGYHCLYCRLKKLIGS